MTFDLSTDEVKEMSWLTFTAFDWSVYVFKDLSTCDWFTVKVNELLALIF